MNVVELYSRPIPTQLKKKLLEENYLKTSFKILPEMRQTNPTNYHTCADSNCISTNFMQMA